MYLWEADHIHCRICGESLPMSRWQDEPLCADCEFDTLTPPAWLEVFLAKLEHWKTNKAS